MTTRLSIRAIAPEGTPGQAAVIASDGLAVEWADPAVVGGGGGVALATAAQGASLTLTTTWADVPGVSLTFNVSAATDKFLVETYLAFLQTTSNPGDGEVRLLIDGTTPTDTKTPLYAEASPVPTRYDTAPHWVLTGLTAGSHVVKFQVRKSAGTANISVTQGVMTIVAGTTASAGGVGDVDGGTWDSTYIDVIDGGTL